jgi:glycosyltransferase involved in cell wall biosynthesis
MTKRRFFYADPGLTDNLGHHANNCRFITSEARSRGMDVNILSFATIDAQLRAELDATPFFRALTAWLSDGDPICGWLNAFHVVAEITREDLSRIGNIGRGDVMYFSSALPAQLFALAQWMGAMPRDKLPLVVVEFGIDPGVDIMQGPDGIVYSFRDPRSDARGILYRSAAARIPPAILPWLQMITFDQGSSSSFCSVLGKHVGVLPTPHVATTPRRSRSGKRPITVAVMGNQRPEKGYQFMPEVARSLLKANPDIRILCHNANPDAMRETQEDMHEIAAKDQRLIMDERMAGGEVWQQILDSSDLILLPYVSPRFAVSYSAIAVEAIANAIPLVVPGGTSMARLVQEFGGAGTTFDRPDAPSIADAAQRALERFDQLATMAYSGSDLWGHVHGPRNMLDAMLALAPKAASVPGVQFPITIVAA